MPPSRRDFPFAIVGFDLDGTLTDTAGDLTAAVNHALSLVARAPLTEAEVRPMIGLGARPMLDQGLAATGGVPELGRASWRERVWRYAQISVDAADLKKKNIPTT